MKEVVIRDREKELKIEKKESEIYYYCPKCGQLLIITNENNEWGQIASCPHYQWEELSISCYIGIGDECDIKQIRQLRFRSLIQIFDDLFVNLLIPKS